MIILSSDRHLSSFGPGLAGLGRCRWVAEMCTLGQL